MTKKVLLFMYGLCLSAIAGILISLFYTLQSYLIDLFWPGELSRPLVNALILIVIAVVILVTRRKFGQLPRNFSNVMVEIRKTGTADYRFLPLQLIIPAIILVSGTSLGPEATLVSSTVLFGIWIGDKLRYVEANYDRLTLANWKTVLTVLATPHRYLNRREDTPEHRGIFLNRKLIKVIYFMNGILWFCIIYNLSGEPSLILRIGTSHWQLEDLIWALPILLVSYLIGHVYLQVMIEIRKMIQSRFFHEIALVIFGGLAIYITSLLAPEILFSGQHNFHLFTTSWAGHSVVYLILISFSKLLLLTICLNTGWVGGDIFPVLFASTVQGLAISRLLPGMDQTYIVVLIAIGLATAILESPLLVGSLMAIMFAPVSLFPVVVGATAILMFVRFLEKRYVKYAPTVFDQMSNWLQIINVFKK
ncbi:chloride channel protein [Secundilactobacillus malefermentans]|uniref:chloride channel protein n=1 Tax=Secundilactobacillus malefermentans TaxID=176292 RepID=UPI0011CA699C|nr:chloride channel protein [Secundilactobacillus malefermentans]QEA31872.1 chloride channel protein [Secundilactobacillus malefermentans]